MAARIRVATIDDAEAIRDIYDPIVRDTAISFETKPPSVLTMQQRIRDNLERWPWLVCEQQDVVVGYVYGTRYRARTAYQWSVEVSVYVDAAEQRRGVARALYEALFATLQLQGFHRAYAGITLPNPATLKTGTGSTRSLIFRCLCQPTPGRPGPTSPKGASR